jgi:tRNA (cytidine/uridine-2'-O-)-methyltransferase
VDVVLVYPEIHANTGNIARTCAVTGTRLHLVEPLGFSLEDRYLRRAGLDYWPLVDLTVHPDLKSVLRQMEGRPRAFLSARGRTLYTDIPFSADLVLFFGRESTGLPDELLAAHPDEVYRVPMRPVPGARSLNLANTVALVLYEGLRRQGFPGLV